MSPEEAINAATLNTAYAIDLLASHGSITVGGMLLSGADVRPETYEPPRGFFVLLSVPTLAEAERVFTLLAEGGSVRSPLQPTFWSPAFGVLVDAFGVPWEVSCEGPPTHGG